MCNLNKECKQDTTPSSRKVIIDSRDNSISQAYSQSKETSAPQYILSRPARCWDMLRSKPQPSLAVHGGKVNRDNNGKLRHRRGQNKVPGK